MQLAGPNAGARQHEALLGLLSLLSGPARSELRLAAASPCAVETPYSAASDKEIKEDKTINDCQLAAIKQRKKAAWRMRHEISDRHVASQNEGDRPGEQAEGDQQAAD